MTYFMTGGAGSFGKRFTKHIIDTTTDDVIVYSRDELKHWTMNDELRSDRVKYIVGDVRDRDSVFSAMPIGCRVVHAAALKHILTGEKQAWEAIQTNVHGTRNVVDAANSRGADMVLISTDKAVEPINLYGATKMCAERLTLQGGQCVVRYGNVFGSSGSILHIFKKQFETGHKFRITDRQMTRFVITFDEAINTVMWAFLRDVPIMIPKMKAIRIVDLARAFDENADFEEIGIQPGEKLAETISLDPRVSSDIVDKYTIDEIRGLIDGEQYYFGRFD